jgi:ABC-type Fe3+/spermidine/putrescine transport system ATPase subunit
LYRAPRDADLAQFLGESNLVEGTLKGETAPNREAVLTALGELEVAAGGGGGVGSGGGSDRVQVMIRPEQILLGQAETFTDTGDVTAHSGVVRSYEYFGHDAVVRVQPDDGGLPELVVRITGGTPLAPGARVGLKVHGPVVVWPEAPKDPSATPESVRTTPA